VHLTGYFVPDIEEELAEVVIQYPASGDIEDKSDSDDVAVDEPYNADTKKLSKKSGLNGNPAAKQTILRSRGLDRIFAFEHPRCVPASGCAGTNEAVVKASKKFLIDLMRRLFKCVYRKGDTAKHIVLQCTFASAQTYKKSFFLAKNSFFFIVQPGTRYALQITTLNVTSIWLLYAA